jgi:hypothetical protein
MKWLKMKSPRERYLHDASFNALVESMVSYIFKCQYTPSEMREAVVLASIIYAERNVSASMPFPKEVMDWLNGVENGEHK